ncbi:MAG: hypothetical protein R3212_14295, partial [Xanthomonadales bacterium]|nr:hypothetical protein [Xanthomonadales bacterium]
MTATLASVFQPNPSQRAVRLVTGTVVAVAVTSGLFWMMQYMLEMGDAELKDEPFRPMLEFVRLQRDEEISRPDDIVRPPPPEPPPQRPQQLDMDDSSKSVPVTDFGLPVSPDVRPDITGDYASDGDYLPFVKVTPIYPQRALARGL